MLKLNKMDYLHWQTDVFKLIFYVYFIEFWQRVCVFAQSCLCVGSFKLSIVGIGHLAWQNYFYAKKCLNLMRILRLFVCVAGAFQLQNEIYCNAANVQLGYMTK